MNRTPRSRWTRGYTFAQVCRVCGLEFRSRRFDAITCSSTCRQRLKRGQAFAYLDGLPKHQRKTERHYHAAHGERIATHRHWLEIVRSRRAEKRTAKQERQHQQMLTEIYADVTRRQLQKEAEERQRKLEIAVVGALIY
jgi:hypothetical protein